MFPRNQYSPAHVEACGRLGLTHFRGNEAKWFYAPAPGKEQTKARRLCRLLDNYVDLSGANVSRPEDGDGPLRDIKSSRFLRPFNRHLARFDGIRLRRIGKAMEAAALSGSTFHLWWHPENFGADLSENMAILTKVLDDFQRLHDEHGIQSRAMCEIASPAPAEPAPQLN